MSIRAANAFLKAAEIEEQKQADQMKLAELHRAVERLTEEFQQRDLDARVHSGHVNHLCKQGRRPTKSILDELEDDRVRVQWLDREIRMRKAEVEQLRAKKYG